MAVKESSFRNYSAPIDTGSGPVDFGSDFFVPAANYTFGNLGLAEVAAKV